MKNTVPVESRTRQRLRLSSLILFIFFALIVVMLVCASMIDKQNLSGNIKQVTGVITEIENDDVIKIVLKEDNIQNVYNVVWGDTVNVDWNKYEGRQVTLVVPQKTFASNPWILGLETDEGTVVDFNDTLKSKRESNDTMILVCAVLAGVLGVATCGVFIWRVNLSPTVERPLDKQYCEFLVQRQPVCPQRRILTIVSFCFVAAILIFGTVSASLSGLAEGNPTLVTPSIVIAVLLAAILIGGIIALVIISNWVFKKEIDYYAENLPFDFSDISHAPIKKSLKLELQQEMKKERARFPHLHGDGGNGFDVEFTADGVNLYLEFNTEEQTNTDVSDVFPEISGSKDAVFEGIDNAKNTPIYFLSYGALNFEAVAHYRKRHHPMMIIIKSRLKPQVDFPEDLVNDLHIAFDVNLQNTINAFNVPVENLDYLLENKKRLMLANCYKKNENKN